MSVTTFSILFWINQSKSRNGLAPIYARITVGGKRVEISLKRSISYEAWDNAKGRAKGTKAEVSRPKIDPCIIAFSVNHHLTKYNNSSLSKMPKCERNTSNNAVSQNALPKPF
jgi:hypothetical protein